METEYDDLDELQQKRDELRKQVREKEDVLRFKDPRKSWGTMTNGFTDRFLPGEDYEERRERSRRRHSGERHGFSAAIEHRIRTTIVQSIGDFAEDNLESKNWARKALGLGVVYLLPILLKKGIELLEEKLEKED